MSFTRQNYFRTVTLLLSDMTRCIKTEATHILVITIKSNTLM
jgi:hypothetical protein